MAVRNMGQIYGKKVTQDAAAYKPLFYPMQGAIKRHTGVPFKTFVNDALNYYKNNGEYKHTDAHTQETSSSEAYVKNYSFPTTCCRYNDCSEIYR
jgi:hypothetical protein